MANGRLTYSVDLALVIDATGSMTPIIELVKGAALSFRDNLAQRMSELGKNIDSLRVRVIAFRDYYADPLADSLKASRFFELPDENQDFAEFMDGIHSHGGGDEPESGLEALAEAILSQWGDAAAKQRQVIVLWTDASAHPLEECKENKPLGYPENIPANLDELTDLWEGPASPMHPSGKRLLLYSPDVHPWNDISNYWENTLHYVSKAGAGLDDHDYRSILDAIVQSV